jgi:hypothetical protein
MRTRVGVSSWAFLADERWRRGKKYSSPDGSILYMYALVHGLLERGYEVVWLMPDRDEEFVKMKGTDAFSAFSQEKRVKAYYATEKTHHIITKDRIVPMWPDVDFVIHEFRMQTPRNVLPINASEYDPDLFLQESLIRYYTEKNVPILCFDSDYKMDPKKDDAQFTFVFDFGNKRGKKHHLDLPIYIEDLLQFEMLEPHQEIAYVGNRYERDGAFQKFLGKGTQDITYHVYGNWLERNRNSKELWPHIQFHKRIHPNQIHKAYQHSLAVPLILRDDYNLHGVMTMRVAESLLFGTIPLLPTDFLSDQYQLIRIKNEEDMLNTVRNGFSHLPTRRLMRKRIIESLEFRDVKYILPQILSKL